MRVGTRIVILGVSLLSLLVVVLALHVWWVKQLARVTSRLPATTFTTGALNLELDRRAVDLESVSRKYVVRGDPVYSTSLDTIGAEFQDGLRDLARLEVSPREREVVTRLQTAWQSYRSLEPLEVVPPPAEGAVEPGSAEQVAQERIQQHLALISVLRTRLSELAEATSAELAERREELRSTLALTRRAAWGLVGFASVLALAVIWWTVRSIHRPLQRLTAATQEVASGRFGLKVDERGGHELSEVAKAFNLMVERLRALDELKRDFLSHVSHELNTPLVAMRETNQLLLDGLVGELNHEQKRMLELNRDAATRLSGMIRRILDLSRLEAGAMEYDFQPHDLGEILEQVREEFGALAHEASIDLEVSLPSDRVVTRCDRDRLLQVFENLVSNAIKFAPHESAVRLELAPSAPRPSQSRWRQRDEGRVTVTVSDEGPGVPEAERAAIFDKFHRGSKRGSHGFGLGLAISREIISAHGGDIWVRSQGGEGSVFGVELTARAESASPRLDPRATSGGAS